MSDKVQNNLELLRFKKSTILKKISTLHDMSLALDIDSGDHTEFEVRFSRLEKNYEDVNRTQTEIVKLMILLQQQSEIEEEEKSMDDVEEMYFQILATYKKIKSSASSNLDKTISLQPQVRLPKIDLPTFNGNLKEWPHFKDLFQSIVHTNDSLPDIEKLHYLVSCLKQEPLQIAKTLPYTASNYLIIWEQLVERYDNKRLLASCYIEEILNAPNLTNESFKKLRSFLDSCSENVTALKAMQFPIDYGDFFLCHIVLQKLDKHTRQLFERHNANVEFPTFENMMAFLKNHCKSLETACLHDKESTRLNNPHAVNVNKFRVFQQNKFSTNKTDLRPATKYSLPQNAHLSTTSSNKPNAIHCLHCNENHCIYRCPTFIALTVPERREFIKSKQACFNCLSYGHSSKSCASNNICKKCSKHHHTMLHEVTTAATPSPLPNENKPVLSTQNKPDASPPAPVSSNVGTSISTTLLGTAAIQVKDSEGNYHTVRALCDPGSQSSFITMECASKFSLPFKECTNTILGISKTPVSSSKGTVDCTIKPRFKNNPCLLVNAIVLDTITAPLPSSTLPSDVKYCFRNLELADPFFDTPGKIDFLIGADLFAEVFDGGRKPSKEGYPTPFRTIFGWVLIGKTMMKTSSTHVMSNLCLTNFPSLDSSIKKFWEIEEPPKKVHVSIDDQTTEKMFIKSVNRETSGRYVVKLPFRSEPPDLGDSYHVAARSFQNLEVRLNRDSELKAQYTNFMNEYLELGHMRSVNMNEEHPQYFIPHHEVFKMSQDGQSRQLRVVFNASAKTSNGKSLNDELFVGPKLQNDICEIISKFRLHNVVFTVDICKMYRQIIIHPDHQKYQAILWRPSTNEPLGCFLLNTVTYGVSSAPYLAIRTLQQLVKDEGESFPLAVKAVMKDIFVDDILTGSNTVQEVLLLKSELISLLNLGGFELKKWASNHPDVLKDVFESNKEIKFTENDAIKVLGVKWLPQSDCFSYDVNVKDHKVTKRSILSIMSSIYDPLGWLTPTILWAKKLMQTLWTLGVDWDTSLSDEIVKLWSQFITELKLLENIRIPRKVLLINCTCIQLHGFCDASSEAYAACLYLRCVSTDGIKTTLVLGKSKVAPIKSLTIPKLELCAATLLSKLIEFYCNALTENITNLTIFAWTDSTVTLSWIRTSPHLLKVFVANRVASIQDIVEPSRWFYVPTQDNPADCPSRGVLPSQLIDHPLWWSGPSWLNKDESHWPQQEIVQLPVNDLPETKAPLLSAVLINSSPQHKFVETFSDLNHLKRITAYLLRFINNCKTSANSRTYGNLSTQELDCALMIWIKCYQKTYFSSDIESIKENNNCSSAIRRLDPYLDNDGVLRVGGRIRHSTLNYDARHPILLPKEGHLVRLIISHYHIVYLHIGPRTLQSLLQRKYWILSARRAIRSQIFKCVKCTRIKAQCPQPFMSDLPAVRITACRPFLKVGVDFGGPFRIKSEKSRKPQVRKAYLCLFVCLSTKALHLEVVSDLSTDAFLAALERMVARRGICSDIFSDNGSNFIGAKSVLNEFYKFLQQSDHYEKINKHLTNKGIIWHLNPPSAPHFGGIWEAGVKSTKFHLVRVIGDQLLTFEELSTLFTQIEAILNSRPLCSLSTDPNEVDVLTPAHFLVGEPLVGIPQPDLTTVPLNRLSRWQLISQARQHFWKRWSTEYLHSLQQRNKWNTRQPSITVGDIVIIKEDNLPPLEWRMGRVIEVFPGRDEVVRVARVKTAQGELTRPVIKLCPLPVND